VPPRVDASLCPEEAAAVKKIQKFSRNKFDKLAVQTKKIVASRNRDPKARTLFFFSIDKKNKKLEIGKKNL
jgi:hypothetical protein